MRCKTLRTRLMVKTGVTLRRDEDQQEAAVGSGELRRTRWRNRLVTAAPCWWDHQTSTVRRDTIWVQCPEPNNKESGMRMTTSMYEANLAQIEIIKDALTVNPDADLHDELRKCEELNLKFEAMEAV